MGFASPSRARAAHAALPHACIDPIPIACEIVHAFQTILTRHKHAADPAVISVTMVHGGEVTNVIPDDCELRGQVRTYSIATLDLIEAKMRTVAEHICLAHDARCEFHFLRNYPPTVNTPAEADFASQVFAGVLGEANVLPQVAAMTAEDFSYMLIAWPGAYIFIGNGEGEHRDPSHGGGPCTLHGASYDFNDALIPIGASCWVALVERFLATSAATA
jgi:hippurate hydrolase